MNWPFPNPDQGTVTGRSEHVMNTLQRIEQALPIGECNGRCQRSFADALALLGKPIEHYTVADLLALAEQHHTQWLESEHHRHSERQFQLDTGALEYTQ
ncbi:hypothetical protein GN155_017650 [Alcanivorax sp. ZXX171]|nr:hypothetical protein [Alcanivorax sp. ZXX171]